MIAFLILRGQRKRKETYSMRVTATIIEAECKTIGSYHTKNYFPVVEYQAGERVVRGNSSFGIDDKRFFNVGQSVELYYDPNQNENFYIPVLEKKSEQVAHIFTMVSYAMLVIGVLVCTFMFLSGRGGG